MVLLLSKGNEPEFHSLRLEQKIRLFFAKLFRKKTPFLYIPKAWLTDSEQWPNEIVDAVNKFTSERQYIWPTQILPTFEDIKKIKDPFFTLPNTKTVAESYANAQVLYAMFCMSKYTRKINWLENLNNSKFYKKVFSNSIGTDLLENMMIAHHLSDYFESRSDRATLLSELYDAHIRLPIQEILDSFGFKYIEREPNPVVDQELISIPDALSAILPLSINANNHIQRYLKYRRSRDFSKIDLPTIFNHLTKMALHPDSLLLDEPTFSNFKEIDTALDRAIPGYTIVRRIAEGAYKEVWKVREDSPIKRDLIYKYVKPNPTKISDKEHISSHDKDNLKKAGGLDNLVKNELEQIEKLRLKGFPIPQLHQILPNGWIEDYIDGENLQQKYGRLRKQFGPLSREVIESACKDFYKICEALSNIHKEKILHRDIKLENFLEDKNTGNIYVTDFGLSLPGTFGARIYAAPEVIRTNGEEYSEFSESWSLGVALYHAVTGEYPFGDDKHSVIELLKSKIKTDKAVENAVQKVCQHSEILVLLYDFWQYFPEKRILIPDALRHLSLKTDSLSQYENIKKAYEHFNKYVSFHDNTTVPPDIKDTIIEVHSGLRKVLHWQHNKNYDTKPDNPPNPSF